MADDEEYEAADVFMAFVEKRGKASIIRHTIYLVDTFSKTIRAKARKVLTRLSGRIEESARSCSESPTRQSRGSS